MSLNLHLLQLFFFEVPETRARGKARGGIRGEETRTHVKNTGGNCVRNTVPKNINEMYKTSWICAYRLEERQFKPCTHPTSTQPISRGKGALTKTTVTGRPKNGRRKKRNQKHTRKHRTREPHQPARRNRSAHHQTGPGNSYYARPPAQTPEHNSPSRVPVFLFSRVKGPKKTCHTRPTNTKEKRRDVRASYDVLLRASRAFSRETARVLLPNEGTHNRTF